MMSPFHVVSPLVGCILMSLLSPTQGFGSGAPNRACVTMTPAHRGQTPQINTAPYAVQVTQSSYLPGQEISVTINTTCRGDFFQGFMIQARRVDANSNMNEPIGFFNIPPGTRVVSGCGGFAQTITHNSQDNKQSVTFIWTAPDQSEGDLVFMTTFARGYTTFWPKIKSSIIQDGQSDVRSDTGGVVFPSPSRCPPPALPEPSTTTTTTTTTTPTTTTTTTTTTPTTTTTTTTTTPTTTTTTTPPATTTMIPFQTKPISRETTTKAPFQDDSQSRPAGTPMSPPSSTPSTSTPPTLDTKSLNEKEKELGQSGVSRLTSSTLFVVSLFVFARGFVTEFQ